MNNMHCFLHDKASSTVAFERLHKLSLLQHAKGECIALITASLAASAMHTDRQLNTLNVLPRSYGMHTGFTALSDCHY